jgi:precorrin-6B methylase 2
MEGLTMNTEYQERDITATYSPEDNKLRLYPLHRLDDETFARVKAAGYKWAPRQKLFVAPMWTPQRADLAEELAGDIGDEDTSLCERAEERAERFEEYSDHRKADYEAAHKAVSAIADNIPLGQPILVGHHSEKHARKDAERIDNGMRKAVKMWDTAKYWERRAEGAIRHAKYKESPQVRARRIKGLEADRRKQVASYTPHGFAYEHKGERYVLCGPKGRGSYHVKESSLPRRKAYAERWIAHINNRLAYEKAMLGEQDALELIAKKPRPKQLPLCNYRAPEGIEIPKMYHKGETEIAPQYEMTKAEWSAIDSDRKGSRVVDNSHRVRYAIIGRSFSDMKRGVVFLTDSKTHPRPGAIEPEPPKPRRTPKAYTPEPVNEEVEALRDSIKAGVQVVTAPQLFPTPKDLAQKMAALSGLTGGRILEPSAGTGNLIRAIVNRATGFDCIREVVAVEQNQHCCDTLEEMRQKFLYATPTNFKIVHGDFLEQNGNLGEFDRVVMNPPFRNGDDIKHIRHALTFLKPGGRLVAICANGPRQRAAFKDTAEHWEDLPAGTFAEQGTQVNTALLVLVK